MLEEREDGFMREAAVFLVQKQLGLSAYKQLRRSKPKSAEDQACAATDGGKVHPGRGGFVTTVESQADHRAPAETAAAVGAAAVARAVKVPRVGKLVAAAVAPRPRSPGGARAGCATATSITSVTAPNRSARVVARGAPHHKVKKDRERGDGGRHASQNINGRRLPGVLRSGTRGVHHPRNQDRRVFGFKKGGGGDKANGGRSVAS